MIRHVVYVRTFLRFYMKSVFFNQKKTEHTLFTTINNNVRKR